MNQEFFGDVDTAHLSYPFQEKSFVISSAHLVRLAEQSHYRLQGDIILFGIRASKTSSPKGQWLKEITLQETAIDHLHLNCLLGVWDRKQHKISVFTASTVPHLDNLIKQRNHPDASISNQLSQGLYQYFIGAHEPEHSEKEEGAFRMNRFVPSAVWRNLGSEHAVLKACIPSDNIHAARTEDEKFCSAGCQVVSGHHDSAMPRGEYQQFRLYAGQSALPSELEIHQPYQYLLTHARHLKAITEGFQSDRLFMGSEGCDVRKIQELLIDKGFLTESQISKGFMDGRSIQAVYEYQKSLSKDADGIWQMSND